MEIKPPLNRALAWILNNTRVTQPELAIGISKSQPYISDLKKGKKPGPVKTWELIANYLNIPYEVLFSFGESMFDNSGPELKRKIERKDIAKAIADWFLHKERQATESRKPSALFPDAIDPAYEILNEVFQERGKELTPTQARKYADALKKIIAADEAGELDNIIPIEKEHQELLLNPGFKNKKKGLKANKLLIRLEQLDKRKFYNRISDLEADVEELEEKKEQENQEGRQAANGTGGE